MGYMFGLIEMCVIDVDPNLGSQHWMGRRNIRIELLDKQNRHGFSDFELDAEANRRNLLEIFF